VELYEYPEGTPLPVEQRPFGGEAKDDQYHPMPKLGGDIPRDRVIILEDTDNDGVADKRTVFLEGLNLASAILCGDGGIYVGQQPHLLHFRDDNGDDKPDAWRVCLTGFGREDTHELLNSFCWGPDGWLYMTHGVFTNSRVRRPGQPQSEGFKFDAGIGRARPIRDSGFQPLRPAVKNRSHHASPWEFEVFADGTSNPWGCDYDAAGNFFASACVIDHFFHMVPGGIYVRQGGAPENPYSYELLPSIVKHKHFRAAYAGVQIYQGGRYPKDTWGHAFIGNIHDNAIHEEVITPVGASFKCEPRRDFLRANDGWFRPVSTQTGPDGLLWIMDWCDKYPCYQNAKANPEGVDRARGRIWRVVNVERTVQSVETSPKTRSTPTRDLADLDLGKLPSTELVKLLEHPNNWMRRMARRMLVENGELVDTQAALTALLKEGAEPRSQIEALWTLHQMEASPLETPKWLLTRELIEFCIQQKNPALRANIARQLGDQFLRASYRAKSLRDVPMSLLEKLHGDVEPEVRHAVAVARRQERSRWLTVDRDVWRYASVMPPASAAEYETRIRDEASLFLASAKETSGPLALMLWMAIEEDFSRSRITAEGRTQWLARIAVQAQPLTHILSHKTMRRLCDTRKAENLDLALDFLDRIQAHDVLLAHALDGLEKGQEGGIIKPVKDFAPFLAALRNHKNEEVRKHAANLAVLWGDAAALDALIATVTNDKAAMAERMLALQTVRKVRSDAVRAGLLKVVQASSLQGGNGQAGSLSRLPQQLALEVIRAAADLGGKELGEALLKVVQASSLQPNSGQAGSLPHLAALDALSSRAEWTKDMLNAIAEKTIPATGFPVSVLRKLATHEDKAIRDQAFKVLGAWQESSDDMKSLIAAKRKACPEGEPDLANGKILFTASCGVCHPFHGGGQQVGPDLIGSGRSNLDALLTNVIDPNQIIGNGYEAITVNTMDKRVISGRLVEDTPSHVKLLSIGGAQTVVPRDQIEKLENTKQSLMPMGFGNLPDKEFRDLVWYILAPPEEGPLTKEKRAALSQSIDLENKPAKPKGTNWRAIDWESVSLWNPDWKVSAPDFERTPVKLADYHGRSNVLLMHPFPDRKTPASFERKMKIEPGKTKLKLTVAADDRGDWLAKVTVNGQAIKEVMIDHEKPRWKEIEADLSKFAGQEVTIRLESHADDWAFEFAYWGGIKME
jgi:putative membrane-bound dehydrogenase-like protein